MKAAYGRIAGAPEEETSAEIVPDRRRELRVPAGYQAILEFSEGDSNKVSLADISTHGCCVRSEAEGMRIGRFVSIGIDDGQMLQAVVRWVRDGAAGMEFLRPIPPERSEWHELIEMSF
jgi:hypothetical protein